MSEPKVIIHKTINTLFEVPNHPAQIFMGKTGIGKFTIEYEDAIIIWKAMENRDGEFYCLDHQFEVGREYSVDTPVFLCENGFHGCLDPKFCSKYYSFNENTVMTQCKVWGEIDFGDSGDGKDKLCAENIEVLQIVPWDAVSRLMNDGIGNTGHNNFGNNNIGIGNFGNWNEGNDNRGDHNYGYRNRGDNNYGDDNVGSFNIGDNNTSQFRFCGSFAITSSMYNIGNNNRGRANYGNNCVGFLNVCDYSYGFCNNKFQPMCDPISRSVYICDTLVTVEGPEAFRKQIYHASTDMYGLLGRVMRKTPERPNPHHRITSFGDDPFPLQNDSILLPFKQRIIDAAYTHRDKYYEKACNTFQTLPSFMLEQSL